MRGVPLEEWLITSYFLIREEDLISGAVDGGVPMHNMNGSFGIQGLGQ